MFKSVRFFDIRGKSMWLKYVFLGPVYMIPPKHGQIHCRDEAI